MFLRMTFAFCLTTSLLLLSGCGIQRVFYRPSTSADILSMYEVVHAAEFGPSQQVPPSNEQSPPDSDDKSNETPPADTDAKAASEDKVVPYTAPGSRVQQLTLIALTVSAFGTSDVGGAGREIAESAMMGFEPVLGGRPGLTAPTTTSLAINGGRPGLQQGFASGLGFAADRNIFTAIANPLSGATGRCTDLTSAGFFANRAACENHFQR